MKPVRNIITLAVSNLALNSDLGIRKVVSREHKNLVNKVHVDLNSISIKHQVNRNVIKDILREKDKVP